MLRLNCKVQNYPWGVIGRDGLVATVAAADTKIQPELPYAEYWLGDHVNGPSRVLIDANDVKLCEVISNKEFCAKFDQQLVDI